MIFKKIFKSSYDRNFILIFFVSILFVGLIAGYKLFFFKSTYVYVKVKIGQGNWWAGTSKPPIWFIRSLKKGDTEKNLLNRPFATILHVRYYPWPATTQYDVYVSLKLRVNKNPKTGKYNFKRSTIGVGSSIDLEFPSVQFSGTVIDLNEKPPQEMYVTKTVTITKRTAYSWEYEAIQIGDTYFDGEDKTIEIVDKKASDLSPQSFFDSYGYSLSTLDPRKYITVRLKMKLMKTDDGLVLGEEQLINPGKWIYLSTKNFTFNDYFVGTIE